MKQVSVFLENRPGTLNSVLDLMAESSIQLCAVCLADVAEYGLCRFLCDKPEEALKILQTAGLAASLTDVMAVAMEDEKAGEAAGIVNVISSAGLNLSYLYSFYYNGTTALALKTDDMAKAVQIAKAADFKIVEL